ncbi:MAG: amino acid adenylation domain-containing protein [Actinophytocola sp.]|uniref:amino acid adenylation domain-containing protein n=1 Tax=Actinophytocola sp. TaxID=1872138 RepID=UPI003C73A738
MNEPATPQAPALADILPLSPLQEGLLYLSSYQPDGPDVYTVQLAVDLTGELEPARLRAAVHALLDRHPNLRACFWFEEVDHPVALIPETVDPQWTEVDLRGLPDPRAEAERVGAEQRAIRFDLATPPLFRFHLLRTADDRHRLVITSHHILLDGWSNALLVREILALYRDPATPPPAGQYRDYLAWLATRDRATSEHAWRTAFADVVSCTPFTSGRPAPGPVTRTALTLESVEHDRVVALARATGVTLNTVLQAAWLTVLAAYAGSTDVVTGQAVAGRPAEVPGVGEAIGLFLNTVPVRGRLRHDEPFADFLRRLAASQTALLDHQYLDLASVTRVAGAGELFDTLLVIENYPVDEAALEQAEAGTGLRVERVSGHDGAHYPVMLTVVPGGGRLRFEVKHRPDALDPATANGILIRLRTLLGAVVADPALPVGHALTAGHTSVAGPIDDITHPDVISSVITRLATYPDAMALIAGQDVLTAGELHRRADALAATLAARGVGPESVVGLATGYHADLVVALLAVLRAGACYLPLDLGYPEERLRFMLTDARPGLVLTRGALPAALAGLASEVDLTTLDLADAPAPTVAVAPDHPAYLVYTSGSTGAPKGVVGTRAGLANRLEWLQRAEPLGTGDVVLAKSSISFLDGSTELLGALVAGAPVVLAPAQDRTDALALVDLIKSHRPTRVTGVPSLLRTLADHGSGALDSVRLWISSGEALTAAHLAALGAASRGRVVNLYGCSEASGDSLYCPDSATELSLGTPVANTVARVLDGWLREVPPGGVGELYLAGDGLARGYLHQPALTAGRFVADPHGAPGERLYRTGDLVRLRQDGTIVHLGRTDEQVKIRGFRVEPAEIESVLSRIDGIAGAAVAVRADGDGPTRVVGYLVTEDGGPLDTGAVRAAAARQLAEHQVPSVFVRLDALPTTPSGKIARRELPAPDLAGLTGTSAPATDDERVLAAIFAEVLGLPSVGTHDGFAELGGDSIVCIQLVSRARAAGLALSPRDVFEHKTVAALAAVGRSQRAESVTDTGAVVLRTWRDRHAGLLAEPGVTDVLPATPLQRGMVFLSGFDPDTDDVYTMQLVLRLTGAIDPNRLRAAAQRVLDRHPALRAGFRVLPGGEVTQVVHTGLTVPWSEHAGADVDAVAAAQRADRFDLAAPPLLRLALVRVAADEHRLVITNHHSVLDGWSVPLFARELFATYAGLDVPATEDTGFRSYLEWLAGKDDDAARTAWRAALTGLAGPTLLVPRPGGYGMILDGPAARRPRCRKAQVQPGTRTFRRLAGEHRDPPITTPIHLDGAPAGPEPGTTTESARLLPLALPDGLAGELTALARASDVTLNTVLQLAWAVVLGRATGSTDVVFGATVSGRSTDLPDVGAIIGLMINTVPVRVRLPMATTIRDSLTELQLAQARLIEHQHTGLADIQRWSGHRTLFDTLLVFESFPIDEDALRDAETAGGLDVAVAGGRSLTHYPLTVTVFPSGGLEIVLEYRADLFDDDTAASIGDRLAEVLAALVRSPDAPLAALPSASAAERGRVLAFGSGAEHPAGESLPELFTRQTERYPGRRAVVCGDDSRTFGDLAEDANRLARALIDRGAGPEQVVAVVLDRSVTAMTAMVAVLLAGAVYLPIDPAYPAERIRAVLADARPAVVIATRDDLGDPLDPTSPEVTGQPTTPLGGPPPRPEHPAYLIYTSGSTGKPKGVLVSHSSIANLFAGHRRALYDPLRASTGRDRLNVAHIWPFAFDAAWQPQLWLFDGHTVHIVSDDDRADPAAIADLLAAQRIDFVEVPPAMLGPLTDLGALDTLPMIGFGGDAVGDAQWRTLAECPDLIAVNLYGPTECTVDALAAFVPDSPTPVVGAPVDNTRAYVLDTALSPVPPGVAGELYLAGAGVARGYLGAPALTADRFVADPFVAGARMYRTGDLARWTDRGAIDFLGRADGQVKVRGFRVELGEVEAALTAHPAVSQAVVTAAGGRLAGYVAPKVDEDELRAWVATRLPDFMVPASVTALDALPLTAHGKVDRARLPAPRFTSGVPYRAPRTDDEHRLCQVFADALGVERVGLDDDFLALGGDSLASMRIIAAGFRLTPKDIFERRTVGALLAPSEEETR